MSKPTVPDLPSAQISAILAFVREHGIRSAHYVGNADRGLIEGLSEMLGKDAVSIMDVTDRWRTDFAFWWDERDFPNTPCPECPDWLEGISSYQEGGPHPPYLLIRDTPWDHRLQLRRIIACHGRKDRHIPGVALIGGGREVSLPRHYKTLSTSEHITLIRRI
ncbi:MAG: hypothetical protein RLZZ398_691 [Verrucomicrobiota bacterium]|jgi:hypothetical protein